MAAYSTAAGGPAAPLSSNDISAVIHYTTSFQAAASQAVAVAGEVEAALQAVKQARLRRAEALGRNSKKAIAAADQVLAAAIIKAERLQAAQAGATTMQASLELSIGVVRSPSAPWRRGFHVGLAKA